MKDDLSSDENGTHAVDQKDRNGQLKRKLAERAAQLAAEKEKNRQLSGEVERLSTLLEQGGVRAEQALRDSEERFRTLADNISQFAWMADSSGSVFWYNRRWYAYTGTTPEEMRGWGWQKVHHPDHVQRVVKKFRRCLRTGEIWEDTFPLRSRHGAYRWFLSRAIPIRDPAGRILRWFGTNTDITELRQAEEALRESESQFRAVFAHVPVGMVVMDLEGRFLHVNEAFCSVVGYSENELLSQCLTFQQLTHPDDLKVNLEEMRRLLAGEIPAYFMEKRYLRKDGSIVWVRKSASLRCERGKPFQVVGLVEDITHRKQAEEELRRLNETLEHRVAERTSLAEARSLQLRALSVELIETEERERRRLAETLHDDLQQILSSARMQLQAARELLPENPLLANVQRLLKDSIDKTRRLSHELSPAVLQHSGLAESLGWMARQMQEQFGLQVELDAQAGSHFEIGALKVFLFRAVQELLFNVVKHAGVKKARVVLRASNGRLLIRVSDPGKGFNPEQLETPSQNSGFGLLSLRERARSIGGRLTIESAPGTGSTFTLEVPIRLPEPDEASVPPVEAVPAKAGPEAAPDNDSGTRVLFVDDHRVMRQGLIQLISGKPHIQAIGEAANGREAIERVRQLHPDVVIMDVSMPEMDGVEATRRIKAEFPRVRVIGLSMYEDEQIARTMQLAGAERLLSKSTSSSELLKAICTVH